MIEADFWQLYGQAARTAVGFFWKAGWAFVLGYWVSGAIQAFVPKGRLTPYMGPADFRSISLATVFGAASSSCSFAALAAARSLIMKGAHFVAAVAFMFASTNLVIELGILILIFLSWQFLVAEIIGGLVLITISSVIIKLTYPRQWFEQARQKVEQEGDEEQDDFDWRQRIRSREGWNLSGHRFVSDWKMVWEEILIGFTIAGFVAVFVPAQIWEGIFLQGYTGMLPGWMITIENAMVAPFVAAATFIGSMGNIPLATVLNSHGVMFAGIMGFIYSDLMVPPLIMINAKYYGWRIALYIAGVMFISIVATALILHYLFAAFGITPESSEEIQNVVHFAFDYTFYMNIVFIGVAGGLVWLHRRYRKDQGSGMDHDMDSDGIKPKRVVALICIAILTSGLITFFVTGAAR
jgi:uncharacterized membrane protein YraQ (UPF0718 family)